MKTALIYSSLAGDNRKLAHGILAVMPRGTTMHPVTSAPDPDGFDLLALGFRIVSEAPDPEMSAYMSRIRDKTVLLFGTPGASPGSERGRRVMRSTERLLAGNRILGGFLCPEDTTPGRREKIIPMPATDLNEETPSLMAS